MNVIRLSQKPVDALRDEASVRAVANYLEKKYRAGGLYKLIFLTGCNTGLRASDLLRLKVGDYRRGYVDIIEKKTNKERHVVFNTSALSAFKDYITFKNLIYWDNNAYVAESRHGLHIETKYMHWLIADACTAVGQPGNWGSHTMRKTFAKKLFYLTGSVSIVMEILQHSKMSITLSYIGITNEALPLEPNPPFTYSSLKELYELVKFY